MKIFIAVILIPISGAVGYLLETKCGIQAPAFYWVMGFITGFIVMMIASH